LPVLTRKADELNPEMDDAVRIVHEYACDELKFAKPRSPVTDRPT